MVIKRIEIDLPPHDNDHCIVLSFDARQRKSRTYDRRLGTILLTDVRTVGMEGGDLSVFAIDPVLIEF